MRNKIIEVAKAEIGTTESPAKSNKTKYGKWFGWDGVAWCAIFVSWVFAQAGKPLGNIGFSKGFAGCGTGLDFFKKKKAVTINPQSGDIVFFNFNGHKNPEQVGIFDSLIDKDSFYSIEGNTSSGEQGSQSNGDGVYRRKRYFKHVVAFINIDKI